MRYNFTKVKALGLYKKYAPPKRGRGYFQIYHYIKNSEFCQELCLFRSELVEVDLWEVGADVGGVASIDIVPSGAHAFYLGGIVELAKESLFEFGWSRARYDTGNIHVRIAGTSKAKIYNADYFVVLV